MIAIEAWPITRLRPDAKNPRKHPEEQIAKICASITAFGWTNPVLVDGEGVLIAGHARLQAAKKLGLAEVPVIVLDHLTPAQRKALLIADNQLAISGSTWDDALLSEILKGLDDDGFDLSLIGFNDDELTRLLGEADTGGGGTDGQEEDIPEAAEVAVTVAGDVWAIGGHRLACVDATNTEAVLAFFGATRANVCVTSPPYASQRAYDPASGFTPIHPSEYVGWYTKIARTIQSTLAPDGSYFLNIKEHADEGQRNLYVKKLTIAHVEQWGWRFVDEFCWRKTDDGVPGGWGNRFKNAWEPVFHFCRQNEIKFRPIAVGHVSADCFDYSKLNPKSKSGSGLLGTGARGAAADRGKNQSSWEQTNKSKDHDGRHEGIARPSNVIEAKTESSQGSHSAPFPRALPEFFIKAYTDAGDIAYDPFAGSGTSLAAAATLKRIGYGTEISPAYCDVIIKRLEALLNKKAVLEATGKTWEETAEERGVDVEDTQ